MQLTVRLIGIDEDTELSVFSVGLAEFPDGKGRSLVFQISLDEPDEQDVGLGMDTYCLITDSAGTTYGGVVECALRDRQLRLVLTEEAAEELETDTTLDLQLEVDDESLSMLRSALGRVLTSGRPDARPARLEI